MTTTPCPSCGADLTTPVTACLSCGLPLVGPLAGRLWQVDQSLVALRTERVELLGRLRAEGFSAVEVGVPAVPAVPAGSPSGPARQASPPRGSWTGQQALLGAGVLLLLVAGAVFLAVAWSRVGVSAQVSVMAAVTVASGAGALRLSTRGLRSSAEAAAVLCVGLAVVDLFAAYALDLAGLRSVEFLHYGVGASVLLASALGLAGSRRPTVRTFQVSSVASAATTPLLALLVDGASAPETATTALVAGLGFTAVARLLPGPWASARVSSLVVACGYLALTLLVGLPAVFAHPLRGAGVVCALVTAAATVAAGWVSRLHLGWAAVGARAPLAVVSLGAGVLTLVGVSGHGGPTSLTVLAVCGAALAAAASMTPRSLPTHVAGVAVVVGHLTAAGAVLALVDRAELLHGAPHRWPLTIALSCIACAAAVAALRRPALRVAAVGYGAACASAASAAAVASSNGQTIAAVLTGTAVLWVGLGAWRLGRDEELSLTFVALATWAVAASFAVEMSMPTLACVLAALGLCALAYGVLPGRGPVAVLGVAGCSAATWTLLYDGSVHTIEAYTLPLAGLAAVVGLVRLRRAPGSPSWLTVGPALSAALLPSAWVSVGDPSLVRPLGVLVVGALVLGVGVALGWVAPVVTGTFTVLVVAVSQLAPYAVGLPRWASLGTVGALLLVAGVRYEQSRRGADDAARWVSALR